jgi:23S rRNA pseudouridine2605 synthase
MSRAQAQSPHRFKSRRPAPRRNVQQQHEVEHDEAPTLEAGHGPQKIHKVLAAAGLGSRREMEELIRAGKVKVNGAVALVGMRVQDGDVSRVGKRQVTVRDSSKLPRIIVYHKPEGEIVSHDDPQGRPSVFEKLPPMRRGKWLAVGRLDYNTSGLLIFTTSGELCNRLMHPRYEVEREYAVRIIGKLNDDNLKQLKKGVRLEDGMARFDVIEERGGRGLNNWYRVVLREGRNRIVRRMFDAAGFRVSRLMRVRFGIVSLPFGLRRGAWREVDEAQTNTLLEWSGTLVNGPETPVTDSSPARGQGGQRANAQHFDGTRPSTAARLNSERFRNGRPASQRPGSARANAQHAGPQRGAPQHYNSTRQGAKGSAFNPAGGRARPGKPDRPRRPFRAK